MIQILAQTTEAVTTDSIYTWVDAPMSVALIFGLAGTFFVGIYLLRRCRQISASKDTEAAPRE